MPSNPEPITDDKILMMLNTGWIEVDLETSDVYCLGEIKSPSIVGNDSVNGTRYRLEFRLNGAKRTILMSRLVYMAGTRSVIPSGHEIHHLDGDRYNDKFENLICVSVQDHLKIHRFQKPKTEEEIPF